METRVQGSFPEPGSEREQKFQEYLSLFKSIVDECIIIKIIIIIKIQLII